MKYLIFIASLFIASCSNDINSVELNKRTETPHVWINEYHYSNLDPSANQEFIEIAGTVGFNLSDIVIQLYKNWNGKTYSTRTLTGVIPNNGSNGIGFIRFTYPVNSIVDTLAGIAVYNKSTLELLQFISYGDTITANNGIAKGYLSELIPFEESNTGTDSVSIQKNGSGRFYSDFNWSGPSYKSPNAINYGQTITP